MLATYPVLNPGFGLGSPRLGIGPMTEEDILRLEQDVLIRLEGEYWYALSAESQTAFQAEKDVCLDWVAQARMDRESETYITASKCITDLMKRVVDVVNDEQQTVEEYPPPFSCPTGWEKTEEG